MKSLSREGVDDQTLGQIYLAVVQLVILYGSDMPFMIPCIGRVLGGFYHRVAQILRERQT